MTGPRPGGPAADVVFFRAPADLRRWFVKHHATEDVLWVGFYKKESGQPSIARVDADRCPGIDLLFVDHRSDIGGQS